VSQEGNFSVATVFIMLAVDTVLFAVLTWYFDQESLDRNLQDCMHMPMSCAEYSYITLQVIGSAHSRRRHMWFPFQLSYWRKDKHKSPTHSCQRGGVHRVSSGSGLMVEVSDLCKVYQGVQGGLGSTYTRLALDSVSLGIRGGRVTAVLGHNGAG
jgi:ABC-type glutathione transport system ATPase component